MRVGSSNETLVVAQATGAAPRHHHPRKAPATPDAGSAVVEQPAVPPGTTAVAAGSGGHVGIAAVAGLGLIVGLAIWVIARLFGRGGMAAANNTVPHVRYQEIPGGFRVTFRRLPLMIQQGIGNAHARQNTDSGRHGHGAAGLAHVFGLLLALLLNITVGLVCWLWLLAFPKRIEVDGESVRVGGKTMRREDFHGFGVGYVGEVQGRRAPMTTLTYVHGTRTFGIGGGWVYQQAVDVVRALNARVSEVPLGAKAAPATTPDVAS